MIHTRVTLSHDIRWMLSIAILLLTNCVPAAANIALSNNARSHNGLPDKCLTQNVFAQQVVRPDSITVVIDRTSKAKDWRARITNAGKIVFDTALPTSTISLRLDASISYYAVCYRTDTGNSKRLYLKRSLMTDSTLRFRCTDSGVFISQNNLMSYVERLDKYRSDAGLILSYPNIDLVTKVNQLDSLLKILQSDLCAGEVGAADCRAIESQIIRPTREYLQSVSARWQRLSQASESEIVDADRFIAAQIARDPSRELLRTSSLSTEAHHLIASIACGIVYKAPAWIRAMRTSSPTRGIDMVTAKLVAYLVGAECSCEAASGLLLISKLGEDFKTCADPLPQFLRSLSERDPLVDCSARKNLDDVCRGLDISKLESVAGLTPDSIKTERLLNKDTIYVLHFWGTWCGPCLAQHADIMLVADTLRSMGVTMIHVSCDNPSSFPKWLKIIGESHNDQLFTSKSSAHSSTSELLSINSYPSYVVVGKGGRILGRLGSYHDIVTMVAASSLH